MDLSLDDYVKKNNISSRGRRDGAAFNKGTSGNKMMPSRKNENAGKTNRGRGRGRGGATRGGAVQKRQNSQKSSPNKAFRGARGGTAPRMSEAAARQKLMQAKRTLQAAIKEAAKYANLVEGSRPTTMPSRRGNNNQAQGNRRGNYLDRLEETNGTSFYNSGNRNQRGAGRGRGQGRGRGRGRGRY